ncbi:MAG: GNAT family N-acetyltransferase [Selenomonadaceae bacterium]
MDITIRPAVSNDLERIVYIENSCFPEKEAADYESLQERLAAFKKSFLVAEKEHKVIGFINGCVAKQKKITDELYHSTTLHDDTAPCQMVFSLAVHPSVQHQGIASLLMEKFIEQTKKRNKDSMALTCKKQLIPFYEQFGYLCEGKSSSLHGDACWYDMTMVL